MSMTLTKINALDAFIKGEKTAGRWDGHKRIYFPVWGLVAANAICMRSLTTGTFVGSVTHGAGFARANDNMSGMLTNSSLPNIGVTKESWHFTVMFKEQDIYDGFAFGRDSSTDFSMFDDWYFLEEPEGQYHAYTRFRVSNRTHYTTGGGYDVNTPRWGVLTVFGTASTVSIKNRTTATDVSSVYSTSEGSPTNTVDFVDSTFSIMGVQFQGIPQTGNSSKYAAFSFGNTMSDASDTAYTLALRTLWQTVTA